MNWMDLLGLVAGVFVAISLLMRSMRWLRPVNMVGCGLFVVWGVLAGATGVWMCNAVGLLVNVYRLLEMRKGHHR